jgi:hypothetical protein
MPVRYKVTATIPQTDAESEICRHRLRKDDPSPFQAVDLSWIAVSVWRQRRLWCRASCCVITTSPAEYICSKSRVYLKDGRCSQHVSYRNKALGDNNQTCRHEVASVT